MANHFKMMQVELERLGYEYQSTNTSGGETWAHSNGHSLVIRPGLAEHAHRSLLRTCRKAVGMSEKTNKRKTAQIKDRQAKKRETDRREIESRLAWLEARIRDLETAAAMRQLTARQQHLLRERLAERQALQRLMTDAPGWA